MSLKSIKHILREMRYFKCLIRRYGKSLYQGKYRLFPSMRAIVLEGEDSIERATPYFEKKIVASKKTALIDKVNALGYYRNRKKGSGDLYEAIYSANNYDKVREIKLFSFERKRILTVCTSKEARNTQLAEYEALHEAFGMPCVTENNLYPNAYEISMVELLPRPEEVEALAEIARCTAAHHRLHPFCDRRSTADVLRADYGDEALSAPLALLASSVSEDAKARSIPLCLQHGDLSRDNLIYGTCDGHEGFFWIDWEHKRARLFFYDYFFYILNTAMYYSDTAALDAYLSGACDAHLDAFFKTFGMTYEKDRKKDYFIIFAVDFLRQRVADLGNVSVLNTYVDFIGNIKFK